MQDGSTTPRSKRTLRLLGMAAVLTVLGAAIGFGALWNSPATYTNNSAKNADFTLKLIQLGIEADFTTVRHISSARLEALLQQGGDVVLFDVREIEEYAVSRLAGAVQVSPDVANAAFMQQHGGALRDKTVIFYCSVGVRSSQLAEQLQDTLRETGVKEVYNLNGGIFNWHNEARALTADTGSTSYVHPYNEYWGQLLERRDLVRYKQT